MTGIFDTVAEFEKFNSKPHLFDCGDPYQMGNTGPDESVYVELVTGHYAEFALRVEQFGGVVLPSLDDE